MTKVKTGKVRFSYLNVFTPRKNGDEGEEKYSAAILIRKDDKATLAEFKRAVEEATELGKTKCWGGKVPNKLTLPIRDGDEDRPDDEAYQGHYFVNVKAGLKNKPQVVKIENGKLVPITDPAEFQSGDYGKAVLNCYPYKHSGNVGIGVGLNSIFFMEKGEALSGGGSAYSDFADEEGVEDVDEWMK